MNLHKLLSVHDFERAALRRLPAILQRYVSAGTEDGLTLRANRDAFARLAFRPRGLANVEHRSTGVELWGRKYASPIGVSPMGALAICRFDCDLDIALAAARQQVPYVLSGLSCVALERMQEAGLDIWYQGYLPGDQERIGALIERLDAAQVKVLVITIDTAVGANREHNERVGFNIPFKLSPKLVLDGLLHPHWAVSVFLRTALAGGIPKFLNASADRGGFYITKAPPGGLREGRERLAWPHLAWIRARWRGKIVLKGVLHPQDAALAVAHGVDAVMVSNHGGRQLETGRAALDALPDIIDAVPSGFPVLIDGGFRRGTDVLKAIALGARMAFVGRPALYGAVAGGVEGCSRVLSILQTEIDRNMALLGVRSLSELTPDYLCSTPSGAAPGARRLALPV